MESDRTPRRLETSAAGFQNSTITALRYVRDMAEIGPTFRLHQRDSYVMLRRIERKAAPN